MDEIEICPICGIKETKGVFFTSERLIARDFYKYKICQYAKKSGCINTFTGAVPDFQKKHSRLISN